MICPHCGGAIKREVTPEQRAQVLKFHEQGYSLRDIQTKTGVSFSNAGRIVRMAKAQAARRKGKGE